MGIPFLPHITTTSLTIIMGKLSQQSLSSNPLFSSIVTLYFLILLYFPHLFFNLIISPLLISTFILLLAVLRLGALQQQQSNITLVKSEYSPLQYQNQNNNNPEAWLGLGLGIQPKVKPILVENDQTKEEAKPKCNGLVVEPYTTPIKPDPKPDPDRKKQVEPLQTMQTSQCLSWAELEPVFSPNLFLEWEVSAPLEVIYEEFEGVEEEEEASNDVFCNKIESYNNVGIMTCKYPTLSRYYPESDSESESESESESDSDSDCSSDEEEEREGLIEIALDYDYYDNSILYNIIMKPIDKVVDYEELRLDDDEDNLIEIDISPTKSTCDFSW